MPVVIRSNSEFSAGQLVLQSHTTRVSEDGFVQVTMNFACLASALQTNLALFRMEAPPPVPLPADARALPLETGNVYLNEINSTAEKGIGYISVLYVGSSLDQKRNVSISEGQRSYSGRGVAAAFSSQPYVALGTFGFTETFDYTSETFTVEWSAIERKDEPTLTPIIKKIRNRKNSIIATSNVIVNASRTEKTELIESLSVNPVGPVKRYSKSVQAQAVSQFE